MVGNNFVGINVRIVSIFIGMEHVRKSANMVYQKWLKEVRIFVDISVTKINTCTIMVLV